MSLLPLPVPGAPAPVAAETGRETARTVVEGGSDAKSNPFTSFLPVPPSAAGKGMPERPIRAASAALGGAAVKFIPAPSPSPGWATVATKRQSTRIAGEKKKYGILGFLIADIPF